MNEDRRDELAERVREDLQAGDEEPLEETSPRRAEILEEIADDALDPKTERELGGVERALEDQTLDREDRA